MQPQSILLASTSIALFLVPGLAGCTADVAPLPESAIRTGGKGELESSDCGGKTATLEAERCSEDQLNDITLELRRVERKIPSLTLFRCASGALTFPWKSLEGLDRVEFSVSYSAVGNRGSRPYQFAHGAVSGPFDGNSIPLGTLDCATGRLSAPR